MRGTKRHLGYRWKKLQSKLYYGRADDRLNCFTRKQAADWIGVRVTLTQQDRENVKLTPYDLAMQALGAMVLSHIPVRDLNFRPKYIYLATMARRVMMAMIDESMVDDRDYVGNKRLEL
jgi:DNA-directed RNA polymerase III subunit RPC2